MAYVDILDTYAGRSNRMARVSLSATGQIEFSSDSKPKLVKTLRQDGIRIAGKLYTTKDGMLFLGKLQEFFTGSAVRATGVQSKHTPRPKPGAFR